MMSLQADLDDQGTELKTAEENAKRAMGDASRLAEELRHEQEHSGQIEKMRRALEAQVKEIQVSDTQWQHCARPRDNVQQL